MPKSRSLRTVYDGAAMPESGDTTPLIAQEMNLDPGLTHALHRVQHEGISTALQREEDDYEVEGDRDGGRPDDGLLGSQVGSSREDMDQDDIVLKGEDKLTKFILILVCSAAISGLLFGEFNPVPLSQRGAMLEES